VVITKKASIDTQDFVQGTSSEKAAPIDRDCFIVWP
jgi:hypothetical protein